MNPGENIVGSYKLALMAEIYESLQFNPTVPNLNIMKHMSTVRGKVPLWVGKLGMTLSILTSAIVLVMALIPSVKGPMSMMWLFGLATVYLFGAFSVVAAYAYKKGSRTYWMLAACRLTFVIASVILILKGV